MSNSADKLARAVTLYTQAVAQSARKSQVYDGWLTKLTRQLEGISSRAEGQMIVNRAMRLSLRFKREMQRIHSKFVKEMDL